MKTSARAVISITTIIALSLVLFFHFTDQQIKSVAETTKENEQVLAIEIENEDPRFPMRLVIPAINVDAHVQHLGVTPKGQMEVPDNTIDVGWFSVGPRPGEKGSAVIAGHYNGENGKTGVLRNLGKLKPGDTIQVVNDLGTSITFIVRESRTYPPGYAEEVFSPNDSGAHLNIITCDGVWDEVNKNYSKRLVVFADIAY